MQLFKRVLQRCTSNFTSARLAVEMGEPDGEREDNRSGTRRNSCSNSDAQAVVPSRPVSLRRFLEQRVSCTFSREIICTGGPWSEPSRVHSEMSLFHATISPLLTLDEARASRLIANSFSSRDGALELEFFPGRGGVV